MSQPTTYVDGSVPPGDVTCSKRSAGLLLKVCSPFFSSDHCQSRHSVKGVHSHPPAALDRSSAHTVFPVRRRSRPHIHARSTPSIPPAASPSLVAPFLQMVPPPKQVHRQEGVSVRGEGTPQPRHGTTVRALSGQRKSNLDARPRPRSAGFAPFANRPPSIGNPLRLRAADLGKQVRATVAQFKLPGYLVDSSNSL
jgi:hypothetical protein